MPTKNLLQQHWETFNQILPIHNNTDKEKQVINHNTYFLNNNNTSSKVQNNNNIESTMEESTPKSNPTTNYKHNTRSRRSNIILPNLPINKVLLQQATKPPSPVRILITLSSNLRIH